MTRPQNHNCNGNGGGNGNNGGNHNTGNNSKRGNHNVGRDHGNADQGLHCDGHIRKAKAIEIPRLMGR